MTNVLFIDDEPERYTTVLSVLQALDEKINIYLASDVRSSIRLLCDSEFDLVIMDVFLPLGEGAEEVLGKRVEIYTGNLIHMGSLELLEFISKMSNRPKVLLHTECYDHDVISVFNQIVDDRLPKPAPVERFIKAVIEALSL
tara:strand:- start:288 stop:713 length:426 start_codon:yes stop_codon:yes gene_type:complete